MDWDIDPILLNENWSDDEFIMGGWCFEEERTSQIKDFSELPEKALLKTFTYLSTKDLKNARRVCKSWNRAAQTPSLWKNVFWRIRNIKDFKTTHAYPNLILSFDLAAFDYVNFEWKDDGKKIKYLHLEICAEHISAFNFIVAHYNTAQTLSITANVCSIFHGHRWQGSFFSELMEYSNLKKFILDRRSMRFQNESVKKAISDSFQRFLEVRGPGLSELILDTHFNLRAYLFKDDLSLPWLSKFTEPVDMNFVNNKLEGIAIDYYQTPRFDPFVHDLLLKCKDLRKISLKGAECPFVNMLKEERHLTHLALEIKSPLGLKRLLNLIHLQRLHLQVPKIDDMIGSLLSANLDHLVDFRIASEKPDRLLDFKALERFLTRHPKLEVLSITCKILFHRLVPSISNKSCPNLRRLKLVGANCKLYSGEPPLQLSKLEVLVIHHRDIITANGCKIYTRLEKYETRLDCPKLKKILILCPTEEAIFIFNDVPSLFEVCLEWEDLYPRFPDFFEEV